MRISAPTVVGILKDHSSRLGVDHSWIVGGGVALLKFDDAEMIQMEPSPTALPGVGKPVHGIFASRSGRFSPNQSQQVVNLLAPPPERQTGMAAVIILTTMTVLLNLMTLNLMTLNLMTPALRPAPCSPSIGKTWRNE